MEPKLPAPEMNPERPTGGEPQTPESLPLPPNPEVGFEREQPTEQRAEATPAAVNAAPVLPTPVVSTVPAPGNASPITATTDDVTDVPLVANDDDLIEKEWVDKAKKIISETRDDPHRREREVGKLQADYLRKRYGKELGTTE